MDILSKTKDCALLKIGVRKNLSSPVPLSEGKLDFFVNELFVRGLRSSIIIIIINFITRIIIMIRMIMMMIVIIISEGDFTVISRNVSWKAPDLPSKVFSSHSNILSDWIGCNKNGWKWS